jgi:Na+/proline symporter
MHWVDWTVVGAYLVWMVYDGLKRTKESDRLEGYLLANRSLPWWAVGLSVMATQLSAITLVGTTGQGYADGMRFVQFYFGLPLAMILLSVTVVPFFHRARVFTAYEYLEKRFDAKTRLLTSLLFLASRGMSCGVIVAAPAVILSIVLGWNLTFTVVVIGLPTVLYTIFGGVQAVTWADVKQMAIIVFGLLSAISVLLLSLPDTVSVSQAFHLAGSAGRLRTLDFSFNLGETYTFWSGMIGGLFLMLSYFGCDQSQVQRYLTAKSIDQARSSLLMSAYVKIPLQALVLLTGVLVFVFYLFAPSPMLFNRAYDAELRSGPRAAEYASLEREFALVATGRQAEAQRAAEARRSGDVAAIAATTDAFTAAEGRVAAVRRRAVTFVRDVTGNQQYNDVNYVFPTFITTRMPIGLVGLMIAAIFAAAMSSIAAELNSLATATVIDIYRRHFRPDANDSHYLRASRIATGFWGLFACLVAVYASTLGSLIEVVNRFGSFFYGSILGVFMLAMLTRRATGTAAFAGLIAGMSGVAAVAFGRPDVSFLWHNVIGAVVVFTVGIILSSMQQGSDRSTARA